MLSGRQFVQDVLRQLLIQLPFIRQDAPVEHNPRCLCREPDQFTHRHPQLFQRLFAANNKSLQRTAVARQQACVENGCVPGGENRWRPAQAPGLQQRFPLFQCLLYGIPGQTRQACVQRQRRRAGGSILHPAGAGCLQQLPGRQPVRQMLACSRKRTILLRICSGSKGKTSRDFFHLYPVIFNMFAGQL